MKNDSITSTIEEITPATAQMWLDASRTENRPMSQAVIDSYADTMRKGNWLVNGEAITFDDRGNLLNGHHRLKAVIASATTIRSFVVRGVDPKSFATYDCGRNRTFGQLICMQGTENGNNVAAIVKAYINLKKGHSFDNGHGISNSKLHETNKTMVDFYIRNKNFFNDVCTKAMQIVSRGRVLITSFVGGSIAYLIRDMGYDENTVYDFFSQLCNADTSSNDTINALRRRLFNERNDRKNKLMSQTHNALAIKCFNAYVAGKKLKVIQWKPEVEGFPKYLAKGEI